MHAARAQLQGFAKGAGATLLTGDCCLASNNGVSGLRCCDAGSELVTGKGCNSCYNSSSGWVALDGGRLRAGEGSSASGNGGAGFCSTSAGSRLVVGTASGCTSADNKGGHWSKEGGELLGAWRAPALWCYLRPLQEPL
jgi:hypothetical protein